MKKINWKDVWNRTWKTFLQGFFSAEIVLTPAMFMEIKDVSTFWKVVTPIIVGGVAGGICAVWNMAKDYFSKEEK